MTRIGLEFSAKTRDEAAARANGHCELCGGRFNGRPEFDHIFPAAYGGPPSLSNCQVLCKSCHAAKTGHDVYGMRKADRVRRANNGAELPKAKIMSRGFPMSDKPKREPRELMPPRQLYKDA